MLKWSVCSPWYPDCIQGLASFEQWTQTPVSIQGLACIQSAACIQGNTAYQQLCECVHVKGEQRRRSWGVLTPTFWQWGVHLYLEPPLFTGMMLKYMSLWPAMPLLNNKVTVFAFYFVKVASEYTISTQNFQNIFWEGQHHIIRPNPRPPTCLRHLDHRTFGTRPQDPQVLWQIAASEGEDRFRAKLQYNM